MALHTYTPTEWKNAPDHKTTPLNANNLNNIETGIENAYTDIAAVADMTKHGIYELWKTTDSSGTFAAGNIDILTDLSVDALIIEFCNASYNTITASVIVEIGMSSTAFYDNIHPTTSKVGQYVRTVTTSQITGGYRLTLTDATLYLQGAIGYAPTSTTVNSVQIPYRVFGIVKNS